MMRRLYAVILSFLIVMGLVSCASVGSGSPLWVKSAPESRKLIYSVGSAKLTTEKNSSDASYGLALSDLVSKLYPVIDEATAEYITDNTLEAYEKIKLSATSTLVSKAVKDEVWTSADGTVWTLVSVAVSDFPSLYEEATEEYIVSLEEKRVTTLEKLDDLIVSLGVEESGVSISLSSEALLLKEKAEKKADEIISIIDSVEKGLRINEVVERIRLSLQTLGYKVN